jgi:D-methionine transport system substrate-binding protein
MGKGLTIFGKVASTVILVMAMAALGAPGAARAADQGGSAPEKKNLKLGCLAYSEPILQWIKEGLAPLGYNVEIVMFDANQLPATALKDGDLDGIFANHRPWIMTFNEQNHCSLDMVKPYYFHSFFGIYSTKWKSLDEIPKDAKIAVPGDPTNLSRSMIILSKAGLIALGEKTGPFYTILDVKDNPRSIKLIETEITQTARSITDVDAIIASAYYVGETGVVDPKSYLFEDPQNKEYPLGLIVRSEDLDAPWAQEAMKVLRSDGYRAKFNEVYKGKYVLFE